MDRHYVEGATRSAVAHAHQLDLAVQEKYKVQFLTYWFDEPRNRIYEILRRLNQDGQHTFRSSGRISGITNLTQSRISELCSKHPHVERKEYELHM
jgi:hypothetical protein